MILGHARVETTRRYVAHVARAAAGGGGERCVADVDAGSGTVTRRSRPAAGRGASGVAGRARPVEGEGRCGDADRAGLGSGRRGCSRRRQTIRCLAITCASGRGAPRAGSYDRSRALGLCDQCAKNYLGRAPRATVGAADARAVQGDADAAARSGRPRGRVVPGVSHAGSRATLRGRTGCARSAAGCATIAARRSRRSSTGTSATRRLGRAARSGAAWSTAAAGGRSPTSGCAAACRRAVAEGPRREAAAVWAVPRRGAVAASA